MTVYSYTLRSTSMLKTEGTDTLLSIVSVIGLVEEENAMVAKTHAPCWWRLWGVHLRRGGAAAVAVGISEAEAGAAAGTGAGRAAEAGGAVEVENNDTFFLARRGEVLGLPPLKS